MSAPSKNRYVSAISAVTGFCRWPPKNKTFRRCPLRRDFHADAASDGSAVCRLCRMQRVKTCVHAAGFDGLPGKPLVISGTSPPCKTGRLKSIGGFGLPAAFFADGGVYAGGEKPCPPRLSLQGLPAAPKAQANPETSQSGFAALRQANRRGFRRAGPFCGGMWVPGLGGSVRGLPHSSQ